jgi:pentatricopeptide repeat protein
MQGRRERESCVFVCVCAKGSMVEECVRVYERLREREFFMCVCEAKKSLCVCVCVCVCVRARARQRERDRQREGERERVAHDSVLMSVNEDLWGDCALV